MGTHTEDGASLGMILNGIALGIGIVIRRWTDGNSSDVFWDELTYADRVSTSRVCSVQLYGDRQSLNILVTIFDVMSINRLAHLATDATVEQRKR
mgnify:CR=1 FL=1